MVGRVGVGFCLWWRDGDGWRRDFGWVFFSRCFSMGIKIYGPISVLECACFSLESVPKQSLLLPCASPSCELPVKLCIHDLSWISGYSTILFYWLWRFVKAHAGTCKVDMD